jgi:hypothetical protein
MEGLYFAYVKTLLYDLLRIAPKIELFYKLRGAGHGPRRLVSQRIGYSGRTGAYKNLRRNLIREAILSKEGTFIENGPNVWLARLSEHVQDHQVAVCIGRRIPYMIFLALALNQERDSKSTYRLGRELRIPLTSLYAAVRSLVRKGLVDQRGLTVADQKSARQLESWLGRYLDLSIQHTNLTHDSSKMFQAVPAYIDGLEALQRVRYTAGMPIGPNPMVIRTYEPYKSFWMKALREVDDFRDRSRAVSVGPARTSTEVIWIAGLPYSSRPKID